MYGPACLGLESEGLAGKSGQPDLVSAFTEYVDEVRMKRLNATLIFTYLAACVAVMIGKEVLRYWRRNG